MRQSDQNAFYFNKPDKKNAPPGLSVHSSFIGGGDRMNETIESIFSQDDAFPIDNYSNPNFNLLRQADSIATKLYKPTSNYQNQPKKILASLIFKHIQVILTLLQECNIVANITKPEDLYSEARLGPAIKMCLGSSRTLDLLFAKMFREKQSLEQHDYLPSIDKISDLLRALNVLKCIFRPNGMFGH